MCFYLFIYTFHITISPFYFKRVKKFQVLPILISVTAHENICCSDQMSFSEKRKRNALMTVFLFGIGVMIPSR